MSFYNHRVSQIRFRTVIRSLGILKTFRSIEYPVDSSDCDVILMKVYFTLSEFYNDSTVFTVVYHMSESKAYIWSFLFSRKFFRTKRGRRTTWYNLSLQYSSIKITSCAICIVFLRKPNASGFLFKFARQLQLYHIILCHTHTKRVTFSPYRMSIQFRINLLSWD